jgi:colicin import membrane protein
MKKLLLALNSLFLLVGVHAQSTVPSSPDQVAAERARIEAERTRLREGVAKDEAACYQRFAVNDCLRGVHTRARAPMEELRRQEILLNDAERQRQTQEQFKEIQEKAAARSQSDELQKREAARQQSEERAKRAEQKKAAASAPVKPVAPRQAAPVSSPGESAQSRAESKKAFEEKQRQAQARKAERDKALAEKAGRPPAKPLPLPP